MVAALAGFAWFIRLAAPLAVCVLRSPSGELVHEAYYCEIGSASTILFYTVVESTNFVVFNKDSEQNSNYFVDLYSVTVQVRGFAKIINEDWLQHLKGQMGRFPFNFSISGVLEHLICFI